MPKSKSEVVWFNGVAFRRYPDSPHWPHRNYYSPNAAARKRGIGALHQEIYKAHYGPIPEGYHIHHIDHNPLNNDPSNLEAMPAGEHNEYHGHHPKKIAWLKRHIKNMQEQAKDWHSSEEGRAWHRAHARKVEANMERVEKVCEVCGGTYEVRVLDAPTSRFCSSKCKAKWRRDSGVDHIEHTCAVCGESFMANKYDKRVVCSRKCGGILRSRRIAAGESHIKLADEERTCPVCGEVFVVKRYSEQVTCGAATCRGQRIREARRREKRSRDENGRFT